jgi:hypothetical protein
VGDRYDRSGGLAGGADGLDRQLTSVAGAGPPRRQDWEVNEDPAGMQNIRESALAPETVASLELLGRVECLNIRSAW